MSNLNPNSTDKCVRAFRLAWWSYLVLLVLPFAIFAFVLWRPTDVGSLPKFAPVGNSWFLITMGYIALAVPAALFYRRHLFIDYGRGNVFEPRRYLIGMLTIWLALEVGIIAPIIGCFLTRSFLPGLLPAIVGFVFYISLWPNGKTMTSRHPGGNEDPEFYEEPR